MVLLQIELILYECRMYILSGDDIDKYIMIPICYSAQVNNKDNDMFDPL
jgi:hypothetical protein